MSHTWSRREFVKSSAAILSAGVWSATSPCRAEERSPNEKLQIALIGLGGQGRTNLKNCASQNIVAVCDVDDERAGKAYEERPGAKKFYDFRQMFDAMESQIDAVVVSTPDHTHFHPAYWALERNKHLYLEKPLCHSVWETRRITDLAREKGVATQLGVQRHALPRLRDSIELIKAGTIGQVHTVYSWIDSTRGMPKIPSGTESIPDHLKWDLWLGPAAERPYHSAYVPYNWRFWWDFGTGESGNWGCHILDIPFWALGLTYPTKVELGPGGEWHEQTTPTAMTTKLVFPATESHGAIDLHWLQGAPEILAELGLERRGMNNLFVGTDGMLLCGFGGWKLLPEEEFAGVEPPRTIPRSPGFYQEWFTACRGGEPATCDFAYSGPLAEAALLGNVAFRARGGFDWDAKSLQANGNPNAERYVRSYYRPGWELV